MMTLTTSVLGGKGVTIFVVPKQAHIDMDNLVDCNYHNLAVPRHILTFDLDRIGMPLESAGGLSVHPHQCMAYTGQGTANTWIKLRVWQSSWQTGEARITESQ